VVSKYLQCDAAAQRTIFSLAVAVQVLRLLKVLPESDLLIASEIMQLASNFLAILTSGL
jgi:hypothetical protein